MRCLSESGVVVLQLPVAGLVEAVVVPAAVPVATAGLVAAVVEFVAPFRVTVVVKLNFRRLMSVSILKSCRPRQFVMGESGSRVRLVRDVFIWHTHTNTDSRRKLNKSRRLINK